MRDPAQLSDSTLLVAVLALIFALSTGVILWSGSEVRYPDEQEYLTLATNLAEKGIFSIKDDVPTAFRPPVYPILLAAFIRLGAGVVTLKLLNVLMLTLSALIMYRYLVATGMGRSSLLGPAWVAAYPALIYSLSTLYPQTLAALLLLGFIYLVFAPGDSAPRPIAGSICFGLLVMTMPIFALMLAVVVPALLYFHGRRPGLRIAATLVLAVAVMISTWTVRNWLALGAFVPISTNAGLVLLRGNSPDARAGSGVNTDISEHIRASRDLNEVERSKYYQRVAIENILSDKKRALVLYLKKLLNHFSFRNELHTSSESSWLRDWLMILTYYPLLLACIARFLAFRRWPIEKWEAVVAVLYVGFALVSAIFFTRIRYRLPLDLVLMLIAASFVGRLLLDRPGLRTSAG